MNPIKQLILIVLVFTCLFANAQSTLTETTLPTGLQALIDSRPDDLQLQKFMANFQASQKKKSSLEREGLTWLLDSTYNYSWENPDWSFERRYKVLSRDAYGNVLTAIQHQFNGSAFTNRFQYESTYHDNLQPKDQRTFAWNSDLQQWMPTNIYEFNEAGDFVLLEFKGWDFATNEYSYGFRFEVTHDNGFTSEENEYEWGPVNDIWNHSYKYSYTPDSNGFRETILSQVVNTPGVFTNIDSIFYENTADGRIETQLNFSWNENPGLWETNSQSMYFYNANNTIDTRIHETWDMNTNDWILYSKDTTSYNTNDQILERKGLYWDTGSSIWVNGYKVQYAYDGNGNELSRTDFGWDSDINDWQANYETLSTYDSHDNQVSFVYKFQDFNTGELVNFDSTAYYYSEIEVMTNTTTLEEQTLEISPNPSSGVFVVTNKLHNEELSFKILDANGKLMKRQVLSASTQQVDLSEMPVGMYFLVLPSGEAHKLIRQ